MSFQSTLEINAFYLKLIRCTGIFPYMLVYEKPDSFPKNFKNKDKKTLNKISFYSSGKYVWLNCAVFTIFVLHIFFEFHQLFAAQFIWRISTTRKILLSCWIWGAITSLVTAAIFHGKRIKICEFLTQLHNFENVIVKGKYIMAQTPTIFMKWFACIRGTYVSSPRYYLCLMRDCILEEWVALARCTLRKLVVVGDKKGPYDKRSSDKRAQKGLLYDNSLSNLRCGEIRPRPSNQNQICEDPAQSLLEVDQASCGYHSSLIGADNFQSNFQPSILVIRLLPPPTHRWEQSPPLMFNCHSKFLNLCHMAWGVSIWSSDIRIHWSNEVLSKNPIIPSYFSRVWRWCSWENLLYHWQ
jgi:hypothetical protein